MLYFYDVNTDYVDYLRTVDSRVPQILYGNNNKFVCGVVLTINSFKYYVPVSHNVNSYPTSFVIKDKDGKAISTLRFNYMFPAKDFTIQVKNFALERQKDINYYNLLLKELRYCRVNQDKIMSLANKVYRKSLSGLEWFQKICCDFKKLELACSNYVK